MNRKIVVFGLLLASFGSVPQAYSTPNLALAANTSASDNGWGGATSKSDLVDGFASYYDTWAHGLAAPWSASGDFHVVLDFASDTTFNSVVAWWHGGADNGANTVQVQSWNATSSNWDTVFSTANALAGLGPLDDPATWSSNPTAFFFPAVTSDKLRFIFDNSEIYQRTGLHGWLYEVAVYNEDAVPEPATLLLLSCGLLGLTYVRTRMS